MSTRPPSPLKKSIKKFLSPSKSKPSPALSSQGAGEQNWTYVGSTSSKYSSDDGGGWIINPHPSTDKENQNTQDIVQKVMGRSPPKLKRNTKSTGVLNSKSGNPDLDREFEELMVPTPQCVAD
jgi:hypothetical protein